MKKFLIALAMLFIIFLNIRALFGESGQDPVDSVSRSWSLNTEIDVFGALMADKNHVFSFGLTGTYLPTVEVTAVEQRVTGDVQSVAVADVAVAERQDGLAGQAEHATHSSKYDMDGRYAADDDFFEEMRYGSSRFYEQRLSDAMKNFRRSSAWNEMGIQHLINLLNFEQKIVGFLLSVRGGELERAVNKRNKTVARSSPTTIQVYDAALDMVTYHPKLEPETYKNKHGEIKMFSGGLTRREKKPYLHSINKRLRSVVHDLSALQVDREA